MYYTYYIYSYYMYTLVSLGYKENKSNGVGDIT